MKIFVKYIISNKTLYLALILFSAVFAVCFASYHLPLAAVIYPAVICFLILTVYSAIRYNKVKKAHNKIENLCIAPAEMITELPNESDCLSNDYRELVLHLKGQVQLLKTQNSRKYSHMVDYYTVWAHQIKTPIASMHLILQNEDSPSSRKIAYDLLRIEQYVDMVLTFLRLESSSTDYVFKSLNLDEIIKKSVKRFSYEFIGKKIQLNLTDTNKKIICDEKWLCLVLEQLLSNALKYTHSGSISIFLNDSDTLCIKDTGIGIAPEDLPRVFENGYTGYNGRINQKASGIGLYLCKRICDNLSIKISIESELNVSTCVYLNFENITKM